MYKTSKFLFVLLLLGAQCLAFAGELYTTIFNVFESVRTERLLVLSAADGRIYRTTRSEENLKYFKSLVGQVVSLSYQENGKEAFITNVRPVERSEVDESVYDINHFRYNELRTFAPTDLQTVENATKIFNGMLNDGDRSRSQCFKRAHMWAYDMWSKLGISSQKIFIFWTKRYSILEEFEWWFHVAPMVIVDGQEYVFDGTFTTKPVPLVEWKEKFMSKNINCPVMEKYQEYEKNQYKKLCFLMKTPMYYFSPLNIEHRDVNNQPRNQWVLSELQDARRAFKGYQKEYEGLDNGKTTITH